MVSTLTISTLLISFFVCLIITPYWIKRAREHGLTGKDMHKKEGKAAELGGLPVICGFLAGLLVYVAIDVFVLKGSGWHIQFIFAAISAVLIATIVGLVDDILGWKIGIRQYQKVLLTISIVFPIMVVNAGHSEMMIPFFGEINFGLIYPLLIVPIAIIGATNGFNMIGGYNGLEAGMGAIILATLGFLAWRAGPSWVAVIAFCMVAALLAFLVYNRYPSMVFPGDTLTYAVGALIAIVAIYGNIEKFALIIFIPYYIEFILKARGKMQKESFGKLLNDGSLEKPYKKYYGLEHIIIDLIKKIKKKAYEWEVVASLVFIQLIVSVITIAYFYLS